MAAAERGSFHMLIFSATQIWLAFKLMDDVEGWLSAILGSSGAACIMVAIILFRQHQRQLLLNPLGTLQNEVHPDALAKQGKDLWIALGMCAVALLAGTIFL